MAVVAPLELLPEVYAFLRAARVGRMATVDQLGLPAVLPICFQIEGTALYTVVDDKPKNVEPMRLQRLGDLGANPSLAVAVDRWDEDWSRLGWVLLRGTAEILAPLSSDQRRAVDLLRAKYPQYRSINLKDQPALRINIMGAHHWGDLSD
ncbi:MAG: TIGR03668 family PPOX class F420-dependent oxidoreductase [bacterium]